MTDARPPRRTPGQRIHYKMMRNGVTPRKESWEDLSEGIRASYDAIAANAPHLVPSEEDIAEMETERL